MLITVPYIYKAEIIKPRCRKTSSVLVRDSIQVEIKETTAEELPVALRVGKDELRWDGKQLWHFNYINIHNEKPKKVKAELVKLNTENEGKDYKYSSKGADAPFFRFWGYHTHDFELRNAWLSNNDVQIKSDVVCREWVSDNKHDVETLAKTIASNLLIVDGYMFTHSSEPRYEIATFGLGNNHGGTALFISNHYNGNISKDRYFNALQFEDASEKANKIALGRGDNKSVPVKVNGGNIIEVLIKDAVKVDPQTQHGDGCEFLNSIEHGIEAAGAVGGLAIAFSKAFR